MPDWMSYKLESRNKSLRSVDDTTLMAESEEELKSLLMRVKQESERSGLKLHIKKKKKAKIMASGHLSAKSLQSYLTLSDPMDCSPPGSSFHGTVQARY